MGEEEFLVMLNSFYCELQRYNFSNNTNGEKGRGGRGRKGGMRKINGSWGKRMEKS